MIVELWVHGGIVQKQARHLRGIERKDDAHLHAETLGFSFYGVWDMVKTP